MRLWGAVGLAAAAVGLLAGCGGEKPKAADAAPFAAAIEDFLKTNSMDMKVDKIESIQTDGDTATVKARMATKEAIYGMKPVWVVVLKKQGDAWKVATWKQEGGG